MAKKTKVENMEKNNKKTLIISLISVFLATVIIFTTLVIVFSGKEEKPENNMFSNDLVAVKFDEGWGYVNSKGEVVINGQFGEAYPFANNGLALVRLDGYYGFINDNGEYKINPIYSDAKSFSDVNNLAVVKRNGRYGYVSSSGEEVIMCQFEMAYPFAENGLALVKIGAKYGFINEKGKFVINPTYDVAESFVNNKLTAVGNATKTGEISYACISNKGELLTDFMLNKVYISEDYVITYDGVYYGFCESDLVPLFKTDQQIAGFPIELDSFASLDEKLVPYRDTETYKYGYLNMLGQVVINAKYDMIGDFCDGLAMVKFDNKYGFINVNDELVVENMYDIVRNYSENYAVVGIEKNGDINYGVVDTAGNVVIDIKYYAVGDVKNGLSYFTAFDSELVGYMNMDGQVIISEVYSAISNSVVAYDFTDDGYVVVKQDSNFGILNKEGKYIVNPYLLGVNY